MTQADINAALKLAAAAKARADATPAGPWDAVSHHDQDYFSVVVRGTVRYVAGVMVSEPTADFLAAVRQDVPALADAVRRLADELLTAWAVLGDATSESAMHRHGYVRGLQDALRTIETIVGETLPNGWRWCDSANGGSVFSASIDAVRTLLPENKT